MTDQMPISFLYTLAKDVIALFKARWRRDPVKVLEHRSKWKEQFQRNLVPVNEFGIRGEAIIRDVSRMDAYPDMDSNRPGLSPWFKVEVKGLYHRGVEVVIRLEALKFEEAWGAWRLALHDEPDIVKAVLVGRIPYDRICAVDWKGDEYYNKPHFYCSFPSQFQAPYEAMVYYEMRLGVDGPYFLELVEQQDLQRA